MRGTGVHNYTFEGVRTVFIELFCAPRSSLDNPSLRVGGAANNSKAFCIIEDGEMDQVFGYWAEDDQTGETGFLPETEDVFWVYDDTNEVWLARRFIGRSLRRGSAKGKGKGKGHKGYKRFKPRRPFNSGKGNDKRGQANAVDSANAASSKGKENKGKSKGKGKVKGKDGAGEKGSGKGKGGYADSVTTTEPTPSTEPTQNSDTSWQTTWWESEWSDANYGNFYIEELLDTSALAVTMQSAYLMGSFETIDINQSPTFVILDLGCTKCMGSRKRVEAYMKAAQPYGFVLNGSDQVPVSHLPTASRTSLNGRSESGFLPVVRFSQTSKFLRKELAPSCSA